MCTAAALPVIGAVISAGASIFSSSKQASAAQDAAKAQAAIPAPPVPQQAKAPDATQSAAALGIGAGTNNVGAGNDQSTLLTGAQGVQDPLSLSAKRLYGGGTTPTTDLLGG